MFTYQYAQPEEYRFSLDSIQLAQFVSEQVKLRENVATLRVLDLCAGCGVLGFELSYYVPSLRFLDFVEIQDVYTDYFYRNVALVNRPELILLWHLQNYDKLLAHEWQNKYDIIISNPPYFLPEHSMLSPSVFKNRCRFYIDSSFQCFLLAIVNSLASGGQAYFLLRSLPAHNYDAFAEMHHVLQSYPVSMRKLESIRGTDVILIKKE